MKAKELTQINNSSVPCYTNVTNLTMARTRELLSCIGKIKSYISAVRAYAYKNKDPRFDVLLKTVELLMAKLAAWNIDLRRNCLMAGIENHIYIGLKRCANDAQDSCIGVADCINRKKYKHIEELLRDCYTSVLFIFDTVNTVARLKQYWYVKERQRLEDRAIAYKRKWMFAVNNGAGARKKNKKAVGQQSAVVQLQQMLREGC
jgi:hypothetical protein